MTRPLAKQLAFAALFAFAFGCGKSTTTPAPDAGATGGSGGSGTGGAATGGADAGMDGGNVCGQCAPGPPNGWDNPVLLWIGAEKDAPTCPVDAPAFAFEGYADLDAPVDCGTCTCGAPSGSCSLPGKMTANAATCALNSNSTPHTPFDPASGWDGSCDPNAAIPSGKLCSGVKCVQSLTIDPLVLTEGGCMPSQPPAQQPPASWKTFARGCQAVPRMPCADASGICLAAAPPQPGWHVCVYQKGDNVCPSFSPYKDKHVFYAGIDDTRGCADCACDAPAGGSCTATISIFTDGACSTLAYATTVDASNPSCHDLPPGTPLGSRSATAPAYTAGTCTPSGGAPTGAATPIQPATYCCLP